MRQHSWGLNTLNTLKAGFVWLTVFVLGLTGIDKVWANDLHPGQRSAANQVPSPATTSSADWYAGVHIQQVKENSQLRSYAYPQLHGLRDASVQGKLNAYLEKAGTPAPASPQDSIQSSYSVLMQRGAFLELMLDSYDYPQGAAHGMPAQTALMMNLSAGRIYHVGDLFKSGTNYLARLSAGVRAQDKQHVLNSFGKFTGVTSHDGYYLSNNGVTVFFNPYEWAPYAYGFPTFTVPFTYLSGIVNHQSPLWQAFHNPAAVAAERAEHSDLNKIRALGYVPVTDPIGSFAETVTNQRQYLYVWDARPQKVQDGSDQKLFFFLGTRYLGTDTWRDHGPVYDLTPTAEGTVSATYLGNAGQKDFTIAFHWTGNKMELTPTFPATYSLWSDQ